jgi:hypothetical protein
MEGLEDQEVMKREEEEDFHRIETTLNRISMVVSYLWYMNVN